MLRLAFALLLALPVSAQMPRDDGPDAFNLGVLGAEGMPLKKPGDEYKLPRHAMAVKVMKVLEGPSKDGGMLEGDVIVGVNGVYLNRRMDVIYQLVDLLEGVTSKKEPKLQLAVWREGAVKQLSIKLPAMGAHTAACPVKCPRCDNMVDESLKFLTEQQAADGGYPIGIGGLNGRVVVTSLAGIAFLANGSTPKDGAYAKNIELAAEFVMKNCGKDEREAFGADPGGGSTPGGGGGNRGGANWNQTNWAYGYGTLFLCEVYKAAPTPELEQKLTEFIQTIEKNQEKSGGWAHGPGGRNALNYLELQIVGNLELAAMGAARKAGITVPQSAIDRGVAYAISTSGGDGGIGYSDQPGQKGGGDPGRTAGCAWAFALLDMQKHDFFPRMASYFKRSIENLPNGHVSPIMHYTSASFACSWLGAAYWKEFMAEFRLEILAARRPDGTFSARPTEESAALHSNTDRELGPSWTTASYAIVLQVQRGKLKILTPAAK